MEQATREPLNEEIVRLRALAELSAKSEANEKQQLQELSEKVAQFQSMENEHAARYVRILAKVVLLFCASF